MILSNIKEAGKYLPSLNLTLENVRLNDFFRRAQDWLTSHIIGTDIEELLEIDIAASAPDPHEDLRTLCQRVIAEMALTTAIPEMDLQLTEAGFAVQDNDDFSPASQARVDRLISKMPERIAADVDALVRFLLDNSNTSESTYSDWRGTDQFKYLTEAFIPLMEQYNKLALPAFKVTSYEEFYVAIPVMAREMQKVADYYVSRREVCRLRELYRDGEALQVHRMAIAEMKSVAVAVYSHDTKCARNHASCARDIMLDDPDNFPMFNASPAFNQKDFSLDGGKTVNFL